VYADGWSSIEGANVVSVFAWAASRWSSVCGIDLVNIDNPVDALILVASSDHVKAAHAQFPDSTNRPINCWIGKENWCFAVDPPRGSIDLGRVLLHEIGHLLGIAHSELGVKESVMNQRYSREIRELAACDKADARARYGLPVKEKPVMCLEETERLGRRILARSWPA
jgi:hypothetical protein